MSNSLINKKLASISCKQVLETGTEKQFIRAKDISWLIETVESQQREIEQMKKLRRVAK